MSRFREMLQKGKKTLEESEGTANKLKEEVEMLTKTVNVLTSELQQWKGKNSDLRSKLSFVSQLTFKDKGK